MFSIFAVIGISFMLSWLTAMMVTPLLGHYVFRCGGLAEGEDAYGGPVFRICVRVVGLALRLRWLVIAGLVGITAACVLAFGSVTQQFFPSAAQGSDIAQTSRPAGLVARDG